MKDKQYRASFGADARHGAFTREHHREAVWCAQNWVRSARAMLEAAIAEGIVLVNAS
jgi:hypothetical protein